MDKQRVQLNKKVEQEATDIIKFNDFKEAYSLYRKLKNLLEDSAYRKTNPELYKKYRHLLAKLKWIALVFFRKEEVLKLFNDNFQETLEMEYFDLGDKLKHFLLGIILTEDRDKIKANIKKILEKNQTRITSQKLSGNLAPTIENWVKIYTGKLGTGKINTVKLRQFFVNNDDFKKLNPIEKERMEKFFKFYESLKYSSFTIEGFEGSVPINTPEFSGYIENGKLVKETKPDLKIQRLLGIISDKVSVGVKSGDSLEIFRKIASQYPVGSLERKAIEEEINKFKR